MKVLYVTNMYPTASYTYNGIHVKEQIDYLTTNYPIDKEIYFIDGGRSKVNYFKSMFTANRLIKKNNYDLVHVHFGLSGLFLLVNPFIKTPVVLTIHGSDINSSKNLGLMKLVTKMVIPLVNRVIILNDKMITKLAAHRKKLVKIPCGINIGQFELERNNHGKQFVIGFPGNKSREVKNYPLFEKIVDGVAARGVQVETVEFHNLTREEVALNLSRLDCLLMTSHSEGSPQIIKEAMASGIPIVSANVGDVELVISDVDNCTVIDSYNPDDYVEAIMKLTTITPEKRITNGKQKLSLLGLDQPSVCSKVYELYKSLVN
ncbi:MAG: glycosyltransferase family 4 protein [Bacteroidota bacterium]